MLAWHPESFWPRFCRRPQQGMLGAADLRAYQVTNFGISYLLGNKGCGRIQRNSGLRFAKAALRLAWHELC